MGLFSAQVREVQRLLIRHREAGQLRILSPGSGLRWPSESSLVLEEETGIELGNPKDGSLYCLLLCADELEGAEGSWLLGPDIGELEGPSAPFAQIVTVSGRFTDEYASYRQLRDALYDTRLKGLMARLQPSRGTIWYRIARQAVQEGLSLAHLGAAISANLKQVEGAEAVQILFLTSSREELGPLREPAYQARRIVAAMVKMQDEMSYDCSCCEYSDVCDTVAELKTLRRELEEKLA